MSLEKIIDHCQRGPASPSVDTPGCGAPIRNVEAISRVNGHNRVRPATRAYKALMAVLDERRLELGLSMERLNDLAGLQDGFFHKMIAPETKHGRQSNWESVDLVMEALFGTDYVIEIKARNYRTPPEQPTRATPCKPRPLIHWRHRKIFAELGKKGGEARAKKYKSMSAEERERIAKKGRKTRRQNRALRSQLQRLSAQAEVNL